MACDECGARTGHKKGCKSPGGQRADRGRQRGVARGKAKTPRRGLMAGARPRECRDCNGTGQKNGKVCPACEGSGEKK